MGKSKSKGMDVNVTAYKWKQLQYKFGGELPPDLNRVWRE